MVFDYVGHVSCAAVAYLKVVSFKDLVQFDDFWKCLSIKRRKDFATFVCTLWLKGGLNVSLSGSILLFRSGLPVFLILDCFIVTRIKGIIVGYNCDDL